MREFLRSVSLSALGVGEDRRLLVAPGVLRGDRESAKARRGARSGIVDVARCLRRQIGPNGGRLMPAITGWLNPWRTRSIIQDRATDLVVRVAAFGDRNDEH